MMITFKNILKEGEVSLQTLYHGCFEDYKGMQIAESGKMLSGIRDVSKYNSGYGFKPMKGQIYLTKSLKIACSYMIVPVRDWTAFSQQEMKQFLHLFQIDQFGWMFVVDSSLENSMPDEDEVATLLIKWHKREAPMLQMDVAQMFDSLNLTDDLLFLPQIAQEIEPEFFFGNGRFYRHTYSKYLLLAKKVIKLLSPQQKQVVIGHTSNLSISKTATVKESWKFDKLLSHKLLPDGSNIWQLAERIK